MSHFREYSANLVEIRPWQLQHHGPPLHAVLINGQDATVFFDHLSDACEFAVKNSYGHLYVRMSDYTEAHYNVDAPVADAAKALADTIGDGLVAPRERPPKAKNTSGGILVRAALGLD